MYIWISEQMTRADWQSADLPSSLRWRLVTIKTVLVHGPGKNLAVRRDKGLTSRLTDWLTDWLTCWLRLVPTELHGSSVQHCSVRKRNIEARSRNHCCRGKGIVITYSDCLSVVLVIRHAMRMRCVIFSSVACLCVPFFPPTLSHKRHDFRGRGGDLLNTKGVFWFSIQLLPETFLILWKIQRDTVINVHRSSHKVPVILVRFEWNFSFPDRFFKKSSNIKFHENPSSGSWDVSCGWTDGQTDMTKLIVAFSQFC